MVSCIMKKNELLFHVATRTLTRFKCVFHFTFKTEGFDASAFAYKLAAWFKI